MPKPTVSNPFELIDDGVLWLTAKQVRFSYRIMGIHPLLSLYGWRIIAVGTAIAANHENLTSLGIILPILSFYALGTWGRYLTEKSFIATEWSLKSYNHCQTKALEGREKNRFRRVIHLLGHLSFICLLIPHKIDQDGTLAGILAIVCNLGLLASVYCEACELPEPDDGITFGRTHPA